MSSTFRLQDASGQLWEYVPDVDGGLIGTKVAALPTTSASGPYTPAGPTVSTVIKRIQVQLDDPSGKRFDTAYILGFLDQNWEDLMTEFEAYGLTFEDQVLVIQSVPAQTKDLSAYQTTGQALQYMIQPKFLEWKVVGDDDTKYKKIPLVDHLRDQQDESISTGIANYEFRDGVIFISASAVDVDIRVRYQSAPTAFTDPTNQIIRGTTNVFVYKAASQIADRNGQAELAQSLAKDLWEAKDNFERVLVRMDQLKIRKFGRMNPRGNTAFGWNTPIA